MELKLIQPGKPTQNAFIESFNGKLRDGCLNEHWFHVILTHLDEDGLAFDVFNLDMDEARPPGGDLLEVPRLAVETAQAKYG